MIEVDSFVYIIFISRVWKFSFISQVWKWADLQCLSRQTCHVSCKTVRLGSGEWQYMPNTWIMLFDPQVHEHVQKMTSVIPAVEKEAETQRCIPAVCSKFRSRILESSLTVFCAVFATTDQDSVCRNPIMLPVFLVWRC